MKEFVLALERKAPIVLLMNLLRGASWLRCAPLALGVLALPSIAAEKSGDSFPEPIVNRDDLRLSPAPFTFVRIKYDDGRNRSSAWSTDYPDADLNLVSRFAAVTGHPCDPAGKVMSLTDAGLGRYPFIYVAEGGEMTLSDAEVAALKAYLEGGGFLLVDDFWGEVEWTNVKRQMERVLPDQTPVDLPLDHEIFRCFYGLREKPQVPNVQRGTLSQFDGITWEREDAQTPHFWGWMDDGGRLMVLCCHNNDLGDGWERFDVNEYYRREFSDKKAFPLGVNILVHALSR